ncbi:MAG: hypothetical protein IJT43_00865 [Stomatobaculum sp.]|nr:hypothetical protein [Stomatobaculum sp.]
MDIFEKNRKLIDRRIEEGLALLRKYYQVEERQDDPQISSPRVAGRLHVARSYDIKGVGNLLTMTCKESEENNLSSFVVMPYFKNLPLFSSDFVYSGENRYFLLEIYDLSVRHDAAFDQGIESFKAFAPAIAELKDIPTQPCWYDDIRPVCYSKAPTPEQDDAAIKGFLDFLTLVIQMEQAAPALTGEDLAVKWQKNREYANRLIDDGGVSTDLFTEALGAENTRRFFHEIFFGSENYKPVG